MALYLLGALECLKNHNPYIFDKVVFAGASAGALISASIVCGISLDYVKIKFLNVAAEAQSKTFGPFTPGFDIEKFLLKSMDHLPKDAHERANGRLHISVTRASDLTNEIISSWNSRDELIQSLICSCFIPIFSGSKFPSFRDRLYLDGGYTNKQPVVTKNTLTISPFTGSAHVCPKTNLSNKEIVWGQYRMELSMDNLRRMYASIMPPKPHQLAHYHKNGSKDMKNFLEKRKIS